MPADEKLFDQYKRCDAHVFSLLHQRHRAALLRFVKRLAPSEMDYEEITQETWMAVIKGRERFEPRARFVTHLFSIAQRRVADETQSGRIFDYHFWSRSQPTNIKALLGADPKGCFAARAIPPLFASTVHRRG